MSSNILDWVFIAILPFAANWLLLIAFAIACSFLSSALININNFCVALEHAM